MRNRKTPIIIIAVLIICLAAAGVLAACSASGADGVGIKSIEKTGSSGNVDTYTIYYTDGNSFEFTVTNGTDGANGTDGTDGADGSSVTALDIYNQYKLATGDEELTYEQFVDAFMDVNVSSDNSDVIASVLRSVASVTTEFYETRYTIGGWTGITTSTGTALYSGSAVIYKIEDEYTYFITNYHVVYSGYGNDDNLKYAESGADSKNIARKIVVYLYGSENTAALTTQKVNNYSGVNYGEYAIECEYVGGSESNDIALIRAKTSDVKSINPEVQAVTFASGYDVGETAIVIGNTGGNGISVTEGIVSVHSEDINLQISSNITVHRSMRIDASMYGGNSGGGCFNLYGELIGVPHAGNGEEEQSINYAVPMDVAKMVADNIYYYAVDGDDSTRGAYSMDFGAEFDEENSRYIYDEAAQSGKIVADCTISSITGGGIASSLGLQSGDVITAFTINGKDEYSISRGYMTEYPLYALKAGDAFTVTYKREGSQYTTESYIVQSANLTKVS